jgi:hypothetical protein
MTSFFDRCALVAREAAALDQELKEKHAAVDAAREELRRVEGQLAQARNKLASLQAAIRP